MGKKKKQRDLTQAEIWDDSALLRSWDDAVEEYKRYHSIHAKGEDIGEVLRNAEAKDSTVEGETDTRMSEDREAAVVVEPGQDGSLPVDATMRDGSPLAYAPGEPDPHNTQSSAVAQLDAEEPQPAVHKSGPAIGGSRGAHNLPQNLLENVQDDSLKNLMMAWYFAGYYTGLHEGQQQM